MNERLRAIRHLALDLDGTIYRGNTLFDTSRPFLALLGELGIGHTFLTNNPSKSVRDYLAHLKRFGITAGPEQLYTSTQATIAHLEQHWPKIKKIFTLGTPSMNAEFSGAGFSMMPESPEAEPDAVVVGFDTTLTYARLCRAAWWISRGKPYFATNPDQVCPTDQPTVLVDCGSLVAALQTATGKAPNAVLGKPDPAMLTGILKRHGLKSCELGMVGDRLNTDIAMAQRAGVLGVLVLTGATTSAEAARHATPADLVVAGLAELGARLRAARGEGVAA